MKADRVQSRTSPDRLAMVGLTALGMALCTPGIGKVATSGQWLAPAGVVGTTLGVVVLAAVGARLLGRSVLFIQSDRAAIALVAAVAVVKIAVATLMLPAA